MYLEIQYLQKLGQSVSLTVSHLHVTMQHVSHLHATIQHVRF